MFSIYLIIDISIFFYYIHYILVFFFLCNIYKIFLYLIFKKKKKKKKKNHLDIITLEFKFNIQNQTKAIHKTETKKI